MVERTNPKTLLVISVLLVGIHSATAAGRPIYVDANAPPAGDGASWATAFKYLQDALADANSNPDPNDIWVAAGVYTPDSNAAEADGTGDRAATFQLINGVGIYGGFAGGESSLDERDWETNETILSGDLAGNDDLIIEPGTGGGYPGENCAEAGPINRGATAFSTIGATTDGPNDCETNQDIWYVYTADFPGYLKVSLCGSDYDTYLSTYEGATCPPTVLLACSNDFYFCGAQSQVAFPVKQGSDYLIRVGGYSSSTGTGTITITMDVGDDNSYHVVTGSGADANAVLHGFTITAGTGGPIRGWSRWVGGGMVNDVGSPTVANCTFSGNSARDRGGGMSNNFASSPTVTNCTFSDNSTVHEFGGGMGNYWYCSPRITNCTFSGNLAGGSGGGIFNLYDSSPIVTNCTFTSNSANNDGGGMCNSGPSGGMGPSSPTVTNCTFGGNSARDGGGMFNGGSPTVTNCTFSGNSANQDGGGMTNTAGASPTMTNCTFSGNSSLLGGGMYNFSSSPTLTNCTFANNSANNDGGGIYNDGSTGGTNPVVVNCILWGNTDSGWLVEAAQIYNYNSTTQVHYTCVQGWTGALGGAGNHGDDPLFVDADGPDNIVGTEDDNLRLSAGSACIDAGVNAAVPADTADLDNDGNTAERTPLDLDYGERFLDDPCTSDTGVPDPPAYPNVVDMGAYEYHYGTGTCWDTAVCAGQPFGDSTCDGNVNLADLFALKAHFGKSAPWTPPECCADFTQDGSINLADLFGLKAGFGSSGYSPSTGNQNCPP
ncbi:MAG: right-handed parallel beta-helix repeat-containing protein [Planctomycetota bacterium]|jgi:predicted outer membrane repeat protein